MHQYPRPVSDAGIMLPVAPHPPHDGLWRKASYVLGAALVALFVWALLDTRWQLSQAIAAISKSNEQNAAKIQDLEKWRVQEEAKDKARKEEHDREMLRYKNLSDQWERREFPRRRRGAEAGE